MQTEQYSPQDFDQFSKETGTIFEDGDNLGFNVGEIARQKKIASALADATAATQVPQATVEAVQQRLEYVPLPQEIVRMMGIKIVRGLRKPHNENNINLFDDSELTAPYLQTKENGPDKYTEKTWSTAESAQDKQPVEDPREVSWKGFHEQSF